MTKEEHTCIRREILKQVQDDIGGTYCYPTTGRAMQPTSEIPRSTLGMTDGDNDGGDGGDNDNQSKHLTQQQVRPLQNSK
jgi:hypothetical protein